MIEGLIIQKLPASQPRRRAEWEASLLKAELGTWDKVVVVVVVKGRGRGKVT
jgi:hypothetical protein